MGHWAQARQIGPYWGMRLVLLLYRLFGFRLCMLVLYPVVIFYWLINRPARQASLQYLERLKAWDPDVPVRASLWFSLQHFAAFTAAMLDKLASWNGDIAIEDVSFYGRDEFMAIASDAEHGRGGVILGSHLGNLEICRALASLNNRARLNVLVHTKHARTFNRLLDDISDNNQVRLIEVTEISPAIAILLQQKITQGEIVCIVGDRVPVKSTGRTVRADFLGHKAHFAQGPFILAALLKCPVYTLFCLKKQGRYHLYFEPFAEQMKLVRKNREASIQAYVMQYAARMEDCCRQAPLQWFNFYPYWQDFDKPEQD